MNRDFKGIWISKEIWFTKELTMQEKLFYVEIDSLDNEKGCFASNDYFGEFFSISPERARKVISSLEKKGYIEKIMKYEKGTKRVEKRILRITQKMILNPIKSSVVESDHTETPTKSSVVENNHTKTLAKSSVVTYDHTDQKTNPTKSSVVENNHTKTLAKSSVVENNRACGHFQPGGVVGNDQYNNTVINNTKTYIYMEHEELIFTNSEAEELKAKYPGIDLENFLIRFKTYFKPHYKSISDTLELWIKNEIETKGTYRKIKTSIPKDSSYHEKDVVEDPETEKEINIEELTPEEQENLVLFQKKYKRPILKSYKQAIK